jgi:hypothetical protein
MLLMMMMTPSGTGRRRACYRTDYRICRRSLPHSKSDGETSPLILVIILVLTVVQAANK